MVSTQLACSDSTVRMRKGVTRVRIGSELVGLEEGRVMWLTLLKAML